MAFPPTFTDTWDITQPPDTQLLNQGALDFRDLKNDIMQRMSLLSGTTANRPTPETVNATWGGVGFGLIFFSTDTGILYQWNGSAWVILSAFNSNTQLANQLPNLTLANDTNIHTIYSFVVDGNLLGTVGGFEFEFFIVVGSVSGVIDVGMSFGGTQFFLEGFGTTASNVWLFKGKVYNQGATNAQNTMVTAVPGNGTFDISGNTLTIDTTANQTLSIQENLSVAADHSHIIIGGFSAWTNL